MVTLFLGQTNVKSPDDRNPAQEGRHPAVTARHGGNLPVT